MTRRFSSAALAATMAFAPMTTFAAPSIKTAIAEAQETPAATLSNPALSGIKAIRWTLGQWSIKDGKPVGVKADQIVRCGISEDRGEINYLTQNLTNQYTVRPDGIVIFLHGKTTEIPESYLIAGTRVNKVENGKQIGIDDNKSQSILTAYQSARDLCAALTEGTILKLLPNLPNHALRSGQFVNTYQGQVAQTLAF